MNTKKTKNPKPELDVSEGQVQGETPQTTGEISAASQLSRSPQPSRETGSQVQAENSLEKRVVSLEETIRRMADMQNDILNYLQAVQKQQSTQIVAQPQPQPQQPQQMTPIERFLNAIADEVAKGIAGTTQGPFPQMLQDMQYRSFMEDQLSWFYMRKGLMRQMLTKTLLTPEEHAGYERMSGEIWKGAPAMSGQVGSTGGTATQPETKKSDATEP